MGRTMEKSEPELPRTPSPEPKHRDNKRKRKTYLPCLGQGVGITEVGGAYEGVVAMEKLRHELEVGGEVQRPP